MKDWETKVEKTTEPGKKFQSVYVFEKGVRKGDGANRDSILWEPHLYMDLFFSSPFVKGFLIAGQKNTRQDFNCPVGCARSGYLGLWEFTQVSPNPAPPQMLFKSYDYNPIISFFLASNSSRERIPASINSLNFFTVSICSSNDITDFCEIGAAV